MKLRNPFCKNFLNKAKKKNTEMNLIWKCRICKNGKLYVMLRNTHYYDKGGIYPVLIISLIKPAENIPYYKVKLRIYQVRDYNNAVIQGENINIWICKNSEDIIKIGDFLNSWIENQEISSKYFTAIPKYSENKIIIFPYKNNYKITLKTREIIIELSKPNELIQKITKYLPLFNCLYIQNKSTIRLMYQ